MGEVIRRITGKKLGEFFRDEVAGPLGVDFHIGLAESEFGRVSQRHPAAAAADRLRCSSTPRWWW